MTRWWPILASVVLACGDNGALPPRPDSTPSDALDPDGPPDANPLAEVQGTGLCDDPGCMTINADILEYEPRFPLYDDGATKRRWMQLPTGTQIDTTNMDRWVFPVGTKFWKEFSRGGIRVETRFITKLLADDLAVNSWFYVSYVWNTAQDEAIATTIGAENANGTQHDVPNRNQCKDCHESLTPGRVLGFQAIQLDFNSTTFIDLEDLIADGKLTTPPTGTVGARFPLPGNSVDQTALGYLHANCGHCHNATSSTHGTVDLELLLETTQLATVQSTPAFLSAVKQADDACDGSDNDLDGRIDNGCPDQTLTIDNMNYPFMIVPDDLANSGLLQRMRTTGIRRMPKIMIEDPDPAGDAAIAAWIGTL